MQQLSLLADHSQHLSVPSGRRPHSLDNGVRMRWVPEYEGLYAVTDDGRVYSYKVRGSRSRTRVRPKELSLVPSSHGYYLVDLCKGGSVEKRPVHRLVLLSFSGAPKPNQIARHLNGDRQDNRIENLSWGTYKENLQDAFRHGTLPSPKNSTSLTDREVSEIRYKYAHGLGRQKSIGASYGISSMTVSKIVRGKIKPDAAGPIKGDDYQKAPIE